MIKGLFLIFLIFLFKLAFFVIPFKTIAFFVFVFGYSFFVFPFVCSFFKNKFLFNFKKNHLKLFKIGLIKFSTTTAAAVVLNIPFCLMLKFNLNKFLTAFCFSFFATIWLNICSFFAFIPLLNNEKILNLILTSFKIAKKNYYKTFAATLKIYIAYFFILPFPFAFKKYVLTIKKIYKLNYGGDDGVRTHDLLNAIQTRSQLR